MQFSAKNGPHNAFRHSDHQRQGPRAQIAGVDVTSLAIGEPNFPTPPMSATPRNRLSTRDLPATPPCPASPPLREAIAGYFKRAYGVDVAPDCTIASNGGKQSLYNLVRRPAQ